jgi:hypothetical protein
MSAVAKKLTMSAVGRGRGVRPRRIALPQQTLSLTATTSTAGNVSAGVEMLRRLFNELKNARCTPDSGSLLLKLMRENCVELEKYHHDLVETIMDYVYPEVMSTDSALVRLTLLQLVEMRARNWQHDPAAEQFYASKRLSFANQQQFKLRQLDKGIGDAAASMSKGRGILKTGLFPRVKCGTADDDSGVKNRGPVLGRGDTDQVKTVLPQLHAALPVPELDATDENVCRMMLGHQHLIAEFEAMKNAVNPQQLYRDKQLAPGVATDRGCNVGLSDNDIDRPGVLTHCTG